MLDILFTTWLFWPAIFALFVLFAGLSENDHGPFAGVIVAALLVSLQLFSTYQPFTAAAADPLRALLFVGGYLLAGFIYMYVKWSFVAHKAAAWLADKANAGSNRYYYNGNSKAIPFKVSDWRGELLTWFVFWPFSGAWTLLNDPIRILFDAVYAWSSKRLQAISDSFFKV